jgi:hypothetical protein
MSRSLEMAADEGPVIRPVAFEMRVVLYTGSFLVGLAGIQTYLLTEDTDRYFAWTIGIPLTTAFLGAGYFSSTLLGLLVARERYWSNARTTVPAVWTFTVLTLLATLLHFEPFRMDTIYGWVWLGVYIIIPLALSVAWVIQIRRPGHAPPRSGALPLWFRAIAAAQGAVLVLLGVGLFIAPETFDGLWPWPLTPLTAGASAAWLIALGILLWHVVLENDWRRGRNPSTGYLLWALLMLIALARYSDTPDWTSAQAWLLLAFVIIAAGSGGYGVYRSWNLVAQP